MVRSGLVDRPSVSHYRLAAHLSLALVIFGFSIWLARDLAPLRSAPVDARLRRLMRRGLTVVGALAAGQIVWGAFVAGLRAGLVYNTFPFMAGHLLPAHMFAFDPPLSNFVQNAGTVQWVHRLLGTALLIAVLVFFRRVRRAGPDRASRRLNHALVALVAAQYLLGVVTLLFRVPVGLGVLHQAGAAAIVGVWVAWVHHVRNLAA
jgi:cytochrome c oxidase assembly protein subunit 15